LALPVFSHFHICRYNDGVSYISETRITALKPLQKKMQSSAPSDNARNATSLCSAVGVDTMTTGIG